MPLFLGVFNSSDKLVFDWTYRARDVSFTTNNHGFAGVSFFVPMSTRNAFLLHDYPGILRIRIKDRSEDVYDGRVEDIKITGEGVEITGFGFWRALYDAPYTALWSDTLVSNWKIANDTDAGQGGLAGDRFDYDTNNRLFMSPRKGNTYTQYGTQARLIYYLPSASVRQAAHITFTYNNILPVGWTSELFSYNSAGTYLATNWTLNGTGALQTGTVTTNLTACDMLVFVIYLSGVGPVVFAPEDGDAYLKVADLRIKSTTTASVYADEIAKALVTYVSGINSTQLSTNTSLIQSPSLDLKDEIYEDMLPADILSNLCEKGDNQTTPRRWEAVVYEDKTLKFRPKASAGRAWYVDASTLEVQKSFENLYNSYYAVYKDVGDKTIRGSVNTDSASVALYGITRRQKVDLDTTSVAQSNVQRDTKLNETKTIVPQANITFTRVYDISGAQWPLYYVRSGDTITARNLPPNLSISVDRIRTFRIDTTDYNASSGEISVTPELPLPNLASQVALATSNTKA